MHGAMNIKFFVLVVPVFVLMGDSNGRHVGGRLLLKYCDLYQRLQLQFYVLLMMGAMDIRNM